MGIYGEDKQELSCLKSAHSALPGETIFAEEEKTVNDKQESTSLNMVHETSPVITVIYDDNLFENIVTYCDMWTMISLNVISKAFQKNTIVQNQLAITQTHIYAHECTPFCIELFAYKTTQAGIMEKNRFGRAIWAFNFFQFGGCDHIDKLLRNQARTFVSI